MQMTDSLSFTLQKLKYHQPIQVPHACYKCCFGPTDEDKLVEAMQKDGSNQSNCGGENGTSTTENSNEDDIGRIRAGSLHSQIIAHSERPDDAMAFYADVCCLYSVY